jgi:transposase-like protein
MDPFLSALEDLSQALSAGEDPEQAIADVAEEHGLAAHALRNRAVRAFGPLDTYKERQAAAKRERQNSAVRANPALAAATFLAEVSNLSPALPPAEWDAQVKRLAAKFGVDPAEHRTAIDRVRRRY